MQTGSIEPNGADDSASIAVRDLPAEKISRTLKLAMLIVSVLSVMLGASIWMIDAHAENPHKGAVPVDVWEMRNALEDERHKGLEKKIDKLGEHAMGPVDWKRRTD